jgi:peptide chain release factor 2
LFNSGILFDLGGKRKEKADIETRMSAGDFWNDQEKAKETVGRLKGLNRVIEPLLALEHSIEELKVLAELTAEGGDEELEKELAAKSAEAEKSFERFELMQMMSGPDDGRNIFFSIQAGAGGTESCDWAEMLLRMYTRYFDGHGFAYGMVDTVPNEGAGIKSVTLDVRGPMAYGYLKSEIGVHRLVRISPFDANKRRHTSFASVDVIPQPDEEAEVEINEKDIELEFFHSGGAGGQHVNKTASAVRIRHLPTGIVVACQQERSQHKNRKMGLKLLAARLRRIDQEKRDAEIAKMYDEKGEIAWGNQIRSYVLQPYQMVKDHRTDHQTGDVNAVLDGKLDPFMLAYLRSRIGQKTPK